MWVKWFNSQSVSLVDVCHIKPLKEAYEGALHYNKNKKSHRYISFVIYLLLIYFLTCRKKLIKAMEDAMEALKSEEKNKG